MGKGDHYAVFGCHSDRRYPQLLVVVTQALIKYYIQDSLNYNGILSAIFLRYIYKGEERKIRFYRCPRPSLYSKWSQLINRKDFEITKDTKVCSNHFKAGETNERGSNSKLVSKGTFTEPDS